MLLSHFSRVRLCATSQTAAHQAPRPWAWCLVSEAWCLSLLQLLASRHVAHLLLHSDFLCSGVLSSRAGPGQALNDWIDEWMQQLALPVWELNAQFWRNSHDSYLPATHTCAHNVCNSHKERKACTSETFTNDLTLEDPVILLNLKFLIWKWD